MKIKADLLKISTNATDVRGVKLEPEQQLARREQVVDAFVRLGYGQGGNVVGSMATSIITDQTAGDLAVSLRGTCGNCKWFDNTRWREDLAVGDAQSAPIERRRMVNKIRAALLKTNNAKVQQLHEGQDGDADVEHMLQALGYCKALFAFYKNQGQANDDALVLVHPISRCPEDAVKNTPPHGLFEPANAAAEAAATAAYDDIMMRAQGK
jgi:hypothetical protein